jgi:4-oxalocrotonate tautomerase
MPIVTIELIEGRSVEQKRKLAKEITESITGTLKVDASSVSIIYHNMKKEDYAHSGVIYADK